MALPIVFSTNAKYIIYCGVAIQSILCNQRENEDFIFYILHNGLKQSDMDKLLKIPKAKIEFIDINQYLDIDEKLLKINEHFSKEMYNRVLIPTIFKDKYQKVLYADCDMVFNISAQELFNIDLKDNLVGAVKDIGIILSDNGYFKNLFEDKDAKNYFNSGLLLMNIPALNEFRLYDKFVEILKKELKFNFPDQDILNIILKDKVLYLDYKYNFQVLTYLDCFKKIYLFYYYKNKLNQELSQEFNNFIEQGNNPAIIHYLGKEKPTKNHSNLLNNYFFYYAIKSPFFNELILKDEESHFSNYKYFKYKIRAKIASKKQHYYIHKLKELERKREILNSLKDNL